MHKRGIIETYVTMEIVMQWVPGHSDIPGNEKADMLAKQGSRQEQPRTDTTFKTVKHISSDEWVGNGNN